MKTTENGNEIFWDGHLCEGTRIDEQNADTFILWTRCGKHDVPANKSYTGPHAPEEIECDDCLKIWTDEQGEPRGAL